MHSIVNNTAPEYLTSRFVRRCDLTSYNLRENEYKLAVPQPRTEFYKRSLIDKHAPLLEKKVKGRLCPWLTQTGNELEGWLTQESSQD